MRGPVTRESTAAVLSDLLTELRDSGADVGVELAAVLERLDILPSCLASLSAHMTALETDEARRRWDGGVEAARAAHPWLVPMAARLLGSKARWDRAGAPDRRGHPHYRISALISIGDGRPINCYIDPEATHYPPAAPRREGEDLHEWYARTGDRQRVIEPCIYAHEVTVYGPPELLEARYRAALASELATYPARSRARGARILRALIGVAG